VIPSDRATTTLLVCVLALAACHRPANDEGSADASAASAPLVPPPEPSFKPSQSPLVSESRRLLPTKVVRVLDRTATVAITNLTDKPVAHVAMWHYFYDANKKCIDRGRGACDVEIAPGATKQCSVTTSDIAFLPRDYRTIEVESYEALGAGGAFVWQNENLVPPCEERPMGGVSDDTLRARTGMMALAVFSGTMRDRPVFYVKNVGHKRTDVLDAVVYYYDKDGTLLRRFEALPKKVAIDPDHYAEVEVGFARIDMPAGTQTQELVVWRARYEDHTEWLNANLKSARRKMGE
jgi:hypothetical protein